MSVLYPKHRKPRCGDRVQFCVMSWFFKDKRVHEGTIVDIRTSENGGDTRYYVDTIVGGQHLDEAMILGREVVAIMKTKPRAHKAKISQRRMKVYQRRASVHKHYDPIVTNILQSLGLIGHRMVETQ